MSLPKIVKYTHLKTSTLTVPFSRSPLRAQGEVGLNAVFIKCRQGFHSNHTVVWMQQFFFNYKNITAGFEKVKKKNASLLSFRMFCASEVVCKILCMSSTTVQIGLLETPSMLNIHVISCCALRVDSTCCCLALHTVWNLFTSFCVSWSPKVKQRVLVVRMYTSGTVGKHIEKLKRFQGHIFLKSGVLFLNVCGGNESSYPLYT